MAKNQQVVLTCQDVDHIYSVSESLYPIDNLNMMLKSLLYKLKEICHAESISIGLHDRKEKEFHFIRTAENMEATAVDELVTMRFPDDYSIAGWVFRERQPVLINNGFVDERFPDINDIKKEMDVRCLVCVPIKFRKKIIGVLCAFNKISGDFSLKDRIILEILSNTVAVAIENAKRYDQIQASCLGLQQENMELLSQIYDHLSFQEIIGSSGAMQKVFKLMEKVIGSTACVYLEGEIGTGKKLFARAIHYNSFLKDKPFVSANCQIFSEDFLEKELLGQVKSTFGGVVVHKKGLLEQAGGGTVFLDEIADMPFALQAKLLQVLQEGVVRPVGSSCSYPVNFRLIVASNRSLKKEVEKGNFQKDLYHQMNLFPILLPPLRDRKDDIPFLAMHFLEQFANKLNWPVPKITPEAMVLLQNFDWPGNIRELENEMERALTLAGGDKEIPSEHLSSKITGLHAKTEMTDPLDGTLKDRVEQIERQMVTRALREAGGNRSLASRILGLTRQGLLNKIKRYNISAI